MARSTTGESIRCLRPNSASRDASTVRFLPRRFNDSLRETPFENAGLIKDNNISEFAAQEEASATTDLGTLITRRWTDMNFEGFSVVEFPPINRAVPGIVCVMCWIGESE
jgi:hypothetical protein